MNLKKIKCVVVDFDETLYSYGDSSCEEYEDYLVEKNLLPEIPDKHEKEKYLKKIYPNYHSIKAIFAYLHDNNMDDSDFRAFYNRVVWDVRTKDTVFIKPEVIKELSKYYPIYIVSDSARVYLEYYLGEANIDKNWFAGVYSNTYDDETYSKIPVMKRILNETGLKPNEIIMIGDSENSDIKPAKLVGFQAKHIKDVFETTEILQELTNLKASKTV
jgi:FMN phosphatase YigB (HAD superfamily)